MKYVSGEILTVDGLKKGYIGFEKNKIVETGSNLPPKKPVCKGLIVPTFVNMHTHIGDSFIKKKNIELPRDVRELVEPPNGLKHRLLQSASKKEIISGMKESIHEMTRSGTSVFYDFREGGIEGIDFLTTALKNSKISSFILSRPKNLVYDHDEINILLEKSHGIGLSSISDWEYSEVEKIAKHTKKKGKIFSIHASERIREDIDLILDLKPDFLVHMVKADESDLIHVKENDIPVVLCPRSNSFFGLKPDIKMMKKTGVNILFGTDNAMLKSCNIVDEISYIKNNFKEFTTKELLSMITYAPRKALNLNCSILCPSSPADFVVLDKKDLRTLYISYR